MPKTSTKTVTKSLNEDTDDAGRGALQALIDARFGGNRAESKLLRTIPLAPGFAMAYYGPCTAGPTPTVRGIMASSYHRHVKGYQVASVIETLTGLVIVLGRISAPPPRPTRARQIAVTDDGCEVFELPRRRRVA